VLRNLLVKNGVSVSDHIETNVVRAKKRHTIKDKLKKLFKLRIMFFSITSSRNFLIIVNPGNLKVKELNGVVSIKKNIKASAD